MQRDIDNNAYNLGSLFAGLRNTAGLLQEEVGLFLGASRATVSRIENGQLTLPVKLQMRIHIIDLVELLCSSPAEVKSCLSYALLDPLHLGEKEKLQLGLLALDPLATNARTDESSRVIALLQNHIQDIFQRAQHFSNPPLTLQAKIQKYETYLQDLQNRSKHQYTNESSFAERLSPAKVEGEKIVVGNQYGDGLLDILPRSLYSLASPNAKQMMEAAGLQRFAVGDCVMITNSPNFTGWVQDDIKTTIVQKPVSLPEDVEAIRREKLPLIERDYKNSSHYHMDSFTPSFSDSGRLHVDLAHIGFYDYFGVTALFDVACLQAEDGSPLTIRQKYGRFALMYAPGEQGRMRIPTPVSLQCLVVTSDDQLLLMKRSPSVAFYPNHWSASFEETMNAPGLDRQGRSSNTDDKDFFAGAIRGLKEELAVESSAISSIKVLSLNVEYLTLSLDVIILCRLALSSEAIRQKWLLQAEDRDEAAILDLLPATLEDVVAKFYSPTLWHPTSRMRLIQYLFHFYGVETVALAIDAFAAQMQQSEQPSGPVHPLVPGHREERTGL